MVLFPSLPPLVLFLKLFLAQRNLHETYLGGLGSYLLVCVVLSFLQLHPSAREQRLHSASTLGKLLLDFFRYYGQARILQKTSDLRGFYGIFIDVRRLLMIFQCFPWIFMDFRQEFRYATMGISVLQGGGLFDRQARGFTTRTRSGAATLCLESPADPSG